MGDVQSIVSQVLGLTTPRNDLNGDSSVNILDAQIVVYAVLGYGCTAR